MVSQALAQLNLDGPALGGGLPLPSGGGMQLSNRQKAAVIVRLLLSEGLSLPLSGLPVDLQTALTEQIGSMRSVDRGTLMSVVDEFLGAVDGIGLSFPGGLEGALSMLDGHISDGAALRLRRRAGMALASDPWERITPLPAELLLPVVEEESVEVGAVVLSKLPVPKAADLLGRLPGDKARRIAYAMSLTANVDPETVLRIGQALACQLDQLPVKAFTAGPVERVGAILNVSAAAIRDDVLEGLDADDRDFAEEVRRAIFTFVQIPKRLEPRDVPKVLRGIEQTELVTALAAATTDDLAPVADFILGNISQRMANGLREEATARGRVKEKDGEEAMNAFIGAIRALEAQGEIALIEDQEE
jgi:flagellar motor switch protein FliG